jgi:hypothetical protein
MQKNKGCCAPAKGRGGLACLLACLLAQLAQLVDKNKKAGLLTLGNKKLLPRKNKRIAKPLSNDKYIIIIKSFTLAFAYFPRPPFYSYIYNNKNKKRGKRPLLVFLFVCLLAPAQQARLIFLILSFFFFCGQPLLCKPQAKVILRINNPQN